MPRPAIAAKTCVMSTFSLVPLMHNDTLQLVTPRHVFEAQLKRQMILDFLTRSCTQRLTSTTNTRGQPFTDNLFVRAPAILQRVPSMLPSASYATKASRSDGESPGGMSTDTLFTISCFRDRRSQCVQRIRLSKRVPKISHAVQAVQQLDKRIVHALLPPGTEVLAEQPSFGDERRREWSSVSCAR